MECVTECRAKSCQCVTRREFLGLSVGAAGFGVLGLPSIAGAAPDHKLTADELNRWFDALMKPSRRLIYRPETNPQAELPIGGIGCGNVYLGVDGSLKDWLIFNNLSPVQSPGSFFAVRASRASGSVAKLLQTSAGAALSGKPVIDGAELCGEYPFGYLSYKDKDLPVDLSLEVFSPMIPLDAKRSAYPAAVCKFTAKNKSVEAVTLSLMLSVQNLAGINTPSERRHTVSVKDDLTTLDLASVKGISAKMGMPVRLVTRKGFVLPGVEMPEDLEIAYAKSDFPESSELADVKGRRNLIWLDSPGCPSITEVETLRDAVKNGAVLVLSNAAGLLKDLATTLRDENKRAGMREDIVIANFESGSYDGWSVQGDAFGKVPANGTLAHQNTVSGWEGRRLVNSFTAGDAPQGKMTSKPFKIERRFLKFLLGGGNHPGRCCLNLVVDGEVVRTRTGDNSEQLKPCVWDVREFEGVSATLEIVDAESGAWGHVLVDDIVLTDSAERLLDAPAAAKLSALLPVAFSDVAASAKSLKLKGRIGEAELPSEFVIEKISGLTDLRLKEGAGQADASDESPALFWRALGKGKVYLAAFPMVGNVDNPAADRTQAMMLLAACAGGRYKAGKGIHPDEASHGDIAISCAHPGVSVLAGWDDPAEVFDAFASEGRLQTAEAVESSPVYPAFKDCGGAIAATVDLKPGETDEVEFLLTWRFPNYYFWNGAKLGNMYASFWDDAVGVAADLARNLKSLREQTGLFRKVLYESTLPYWLIDCLSSQSSTIRSEVCIWTAENAFAGYEGSGGCCPMNCSHVWGYEQTLSRLYPDLERLMRKADLKHQQNADGGMNNRIVLPLANTPTGERPFADGHASGILKAYREHLNSPNEAFLRQYYPNVKLAVDYLLKLDVDGDGIIEGEQWNTYDCQVTGPNSFIGTYYLAALRAGEEMAKLMGDAASADRWRKVFESGSKRLVELCWNGEYFEQIFPDYLKAPTQYGPGCLADQLIGQWWAHQLGLGYLLPEKMVKKTLESIFKYNWISDFSDFRHSQRVFADGHDKGLLCCTWPKGGRPPVPIYYCDEVWTGVEYQVAAHMAYEGMLKECLAIVAAARQRYDGAKRNPWNELECGGHYARALSSWSLLLALSGFEYDGPKGRLSFNPVFNPDEYKSMFTAAEGWGSFSQKRVEGKQNNTLFIALGKVKLTTFSVGLPAGKKAVRGVATLDGRAVGSAAIRKGYAVLEVSALALKAGQRLDLTIEFS